MAWTSADLTLVDDAIRSILSGGQRLTVFNRAYERANLAELRALRAEIATEISRESRGGMRVRQGRPI